ncbi:MAG: hypothetical protein JWO58_2160 [Chitinophagaceae bacterium]|nr:hypothetical protein [Chitinophagaceae bacterium]
METKLTGTSSIVINAAAYQVWAALTQPALIKQYFYGTDAISDWKVGSPLIFKGKWQGKTYEDKGIILDSEPNKLFRYKYWSSMSGTEDKAENYATITYELGEYNGKTTLTITQDNIASESSRAQSQQNWQNVLNELKKLLESKVNV